MKYDIKIESDGIIITLYGAVSGHDLRLLNCNLMTEKDFPKWRYKIWDFSNADKIDLSLDDLRSFIFQDSIAAGKNPNVKVAIIPGQHQRTGLDDVFHLFSKQWNGYESKSFRNVKNAKEWIAQENKRST